jgi:hypothetical protein
MCFALLNEPDDRNTFVDIPLVEHDDVLPCNYFAGKIAAYGTACAMIIGPRNRRISSGVYSWNF